MSLQEMVYLVIKTTDEDYREINGVFTGPEAKERAEQVRRLLDMAGEGKDQPDTFYSVESRLTNPTNEALGLGAPLPEVATDPFVQAAIADIFVKGQAIVPSWLNVEWLRYEVSKKTNEDIMADGQILKLASVQRVSFGMYCPDRDAGFMES
ncbi:hypothetical protein SEA_YARA_77 [Streptomyces phage Yara]|nr:hypothetical protein SEA_YARA_77 [Streptomyces phage Yara]